MNKNKLAVLFISIGLLIITIMLAVSRLNQNTLRPIRKPDENKIRIVTTIFPIYDWVMNIASGTDADVHLLSKMGMDIHAFQPSVADVVSIIDSDIFVYVGGESDRWVFDALKNVDKAKTSAIDCIKSLEKRAKAEEIIEGMQHKGEDVNEGSETDEHIWLSVRNAQIIVKKITDEMCKKDKKNAQAYKSNCEKYIEKLVNMDNMYIQSINQCEKRVMVFADKFPFRYLMDDYGIKYYAAFPGCSTESKASFETIKFLAKKVDESSLSAIIKIEDTPKDLAYSVKNNTAYKNQEILVLDSMQSTMHKHSVKNDYLDIMYSNLDVIEKALVVSKTPTSEPDEIDGE